LGEGEEGGRKEAWLSVLFFYLTAKSRSRSAPYTNEPDVSNGKIRKRRALIFSHAELAEESLSSEGSQLRHSTHNTRSSAMEEEGNKQTTN